MRLLEGIVFGMLAAGLHLGGFLYLDLAQSHSSGAGEGGTAQISLNIDGGDFTALIEEWQRPPDLAEAIERPQEPTPLNEQITRPQAETEVPRLTEIATMTAPVAEMGMQIPQEFVPAPISAPETPRLSMSVENTDVIPTQYRRVTEAPNRPKPSILDATALQQSLPEIDQTPADVNTLAPERSQRPKPRPAPPPKPTPAPKPQTQKITQKASGVSTSKTTNKSAGSAKQPAKTAAAPKGDSKKAVAQWGSGIRTAIERKKRYPRGTNASGSVTVSLTVSRAGKLLGVKLVKSSGVAALDNAALKAVKAARFPAAPKSVTRQSATFQVSIKLKR